MSLRRILAGAVCALGLSAVSAAAYVIDLTDPGSVTGVGSQTGGFTSSGVGGTITAHAGCEGHWLIPCYPEITQDASAGIGVLSPPLDGDEAVDGVFDESLHFSFGWAVKVISVTFGWWDGEDDVVVSGGPGTLSVNGDTATWTFDAPVATTELSVFAYDAFECSAYVWVFCVAGGPDDIAVSSIEVSSVPLPAGGLLLLGGLGGLAALRRRKAA